MATPTISNLSVSGFRALGPGEVSVDLAPVTVIVGENGAGKTSLLQALAVTAQSALDDPRRSDLILDGSLIELGIPEGKDYRDAYREVVFAKEGERNVSVYLECSVESAAWPSSAVRPEKVVSSQDAKWMAAKTWPPRRVGYGWSRRGITWPVFSHRFTVDGFPLLAVEGDFQAASANSGTHQLTWTVGEGKYEFNRGGAQRKSPDRVLDEVFSRITRTELLPESERLHYGDMETVLPLVRAVAGEVRSRLALVSLVEPLRGKQLAHHDVGPEVSVVGPHGEMIVRFLNLIQHRGSSEFDLLKKWAARFGLPSIETGWGGGDQLKVAFRDPFTQTPLDLRDAATGSYQGLLMAAQVLLSRKGSVILFEEPEANLHPRFEKQLPELYADAAASGHQVIVTTHSEVLVAAIANEVRKGRLRPSDVAVWELSRGAAGVAATRIRVSERGNLETWVRGFAAAERELFDEWKEGAVQAAPQGAAHGHRHARSARAGGKSEKTRRSTRKRPR